jgi:hypothetical protein
MPTGAGGVRRTTATFSVQYSPKCAPYTPARWAHHLQSHSAPMRATLRSTTVLLPSLQAYPPGPRSKPARCQQADAPRVKFVTTAIATARKNSGRTAPERAFWCRARSRELVDFRRWLISVIRFGSIYKRGPWTRQAGIVALLAALSLPMLGACGQYATPDGTQVASRRSASSSTTHSRRLWISVLRGPVREINFSTPVTCSITREEGRSGTPQASAPRSVEMPPLLAMSCPPVPSSSIADRSQPKAWPTVLPSSVGEKLSHGRS